MPVSMRGDNSWNAGIYEAAKMSSIHGLPTRGSDATILITRVHLHPLCQLVEFWARFSQEGAADYLSLAKDIQSPGNIFKEFEGNPGDQCLAQKDGIWYRARIVSRNRSQYIVFLIDKGMTYGTISTMLAWGKKENFYLPPEVEFCVLANVLPVSPENRWSPVALDFLKSLTGRSVKVHVQDVLMVHRMFVLQIPCISKQMYEMGFARKLTTEMFQDFLLASLQCKSGPILPLEPQSVISMGTGERLHKKEMFLYPELQAGTVETVVVTEVTNPQRIFCQLKVFSQELKKLSEQLTQCCDGRTTSCTIGPDMIGFPCASRGSDGKWYRSVLQQVFPANKVVEVLNVDYGTKQIVQVENVRPLASEFFRMPVVTYNCSLHGIIDKGVGWTTAQIDYLRTLLLLKTIIAKFEYQSITEGIYYVTLYGDENSNINNLFGSKESCLLQCEKTLGDYAIRASGHSRRSNTYVQFKRKGGVEEKKSRAQSQLLPVEDLPINSAHKAFVQYVSSPSEFWIQTQNFAKELDELMDKMSNLYQNDLNDDVVETPSVGHYCAAKAEDGEYYRATVTEVGNTNVKVYFVDYGNSDTVDSRCIKSLPDEFRKLPQLALKCTLADVRPKDGEWSKEGCELFTKTIMDKALNVHVAAKSDDGYVVRLTDPEAQGEKDLAKHMCAAGFAEKDETRRQSEVRIGSPFAGPSTKQFPGQFSGMSFQSQNAVVPGSNENVFATFKEQMFSIGSILDVNVSYIESPNDFWCQLVQSAGHLKLLMYDMQAYYRNREFQPLVETACVARHPENGMWYRALIVHKHETPHVDVLFIDYGQTETVSIFDLRRIEKEFVTLPGQAFRCSLFNPVDLTSTINDWTEEAVDRFHTFVETAANSFVILKCTIYAVMYSEQKIVFNIVDLETPFESICTSLVNLVKNAPPKMPSGPSFRLDTYYYSTHNVKTGTEEQVIVTSVKNVSHFYCQLQKNANILEGLQLKVANLCEQLQKIKTPPVFGTLCFAKYTDGQWYRGQIKATKPSILVHFVDYGDTLEVDQSNLLPIPKEASDIMAVPVQGVLCSLSDIPDNVPSDVNSWFETSSTECEFRALIVAKEPDGKLLVELYQGKTQVNSKIKKMFQLEMCTEEPTVCQNKKSFELSVKPAQKNANGVSKQSPELEDAKLSNNTESFVSKPPHLKNEPNSVDRKVQPITKPRQNVKENRQLYKPPQQRELNVKAANGAPKSSEPPHSKQKDKNPPIHTIPNIHNTSQHLPSPLTESWIDNNNVPQLKIEKLPKLTDLPTKSITSGMVADVYVSHCNSPLSFYVQLVKEEDDIFSIVEKLNDPETASKRDAITDVQPGDIVQAEFADDSLWYRAVVKEKQKDVTVLVEFVDFGNTALVPYLKMSKLDKSFLRLPAYSIHCMLSSATILEKEKVLNQAVVSAFESAIGGNGEKQLKCTFIRLSGTVWEVSLEDDGLEVECKVSAESQPDDTEVAKVEEPSEAKITDSCSLLFKQQDFQEGQQLQVYITAITDVQTFWCQSADTEELDQISHSVAGAGDGADPKYLPSVSFSVGSPCIALFSEDHLWYRAEVLNKAEDEVSLLFVDYGNTSQVRPSDVRPIPPELVRNPVQAFLCELEGFVSSDGSWDTSAADELSALTADQLLQLTVTKVTKEEGKTKCFVCLECEGQVINESMREFWKSTVSEPVLDQLETSSETQCLCEETVEEAVPLEEPKELESCDVSGADVLPQDQDVKEIVELFTEDQAAATESSPQIRKDLEEHTESLIEGEDQLVADNTQISPENSLVSFAVPLDESEDQMCSTCSYSQILESLEVNISAITPELSDALQSDIAMEETLLYCSGEENEDLTNNEANVMDKDLDEQDVSTLDTTGPEDMGSPLDECFLEATESGFIDSPVEPLSKEAGVDSDISNLFNSNQKAETPEVVIPEASAASVTSTRMVPHLAFDLKQDLSKTSPELKTPDETTEESQQNEDLLIPRSDVPPQDSFDSDQNTETPETVIPETPSASETSARMVPRLTFDLKCKTSPEHETPDETTEEPQQNEDLLIPRSDVLPQDLLDSDQDPETPEKVIPETTSTSETSARMNDDLLLLPSSDVLPEDSFDSDQDTESPEKVIPETPSCLNEDLPRSDVPPQDLLDSDQDPETREKVIPEIPSNSETSMIMNEDLPGSDVPCQDLLDSDQDPETREKIIPETPSACETSTRMNEDLLMPGSDVPPQNLFDSDQDPETPEKVIPETPSTSETSVRMDEDLLLLPSSDVLPQDSFDSDQDTETPQKVIPETPATETAARMKEDLLLLPSSDVPPQNSFEKELEAEASGDTQLIVLEHTETEAEPESCMFSSEMTELAEHMGCLVEEANVTDICAGEEPAAESVSVEHLEVTLLKQMEAYLTTELSAYNEETFSGGDTAAIEPHIYTVTPTEKGDMAEEETHFTEACLLDFCSDEKAQMENRSLSDASGDRLRSVAEEETDERPPSVEVPCGQLIVLDDTHTEAEPESSTFSSFSHFSEMTELADHMSCLVEEASVADICAGEEPVAESESSESLEDSILKQMEDSSDDTLTEESFADDSYEAQLSKITHLSLIIKDGSAPEHLPEE